MAKGKRSQSRTAKPESTNDRSNRSVDREPTGFGEPPDEFVTDAEIEAREIQRRRPKGESAWRKKAR